MNQRLFRTLCLCVAAQLCTVSMIQAALISVNSKASFMAFGISHDGTVMVGRTHDRAFRWVQGQGMNSLVGD